MAKFHGILLSFSNVSISYRGLGGMEGKGWVDRWVGGGKNSSMEHSTSSHDTYTVANDTPVGHKVSAWEQTQVLIGQLMPSTGAIDFAGPEKWPLHL